MTNKIERVAKALFEQWLQRDEVVREQAANGPITPWDKQCDLARSRWVLSACAAIEAMPETDADVPERYYLTTDNDSHWYVVPVSKASEWDEWLLLARDDERAWTEPEFAKAVGGTPCLVTFGEPEIA